MGVALVWHCRFVAFQGLFLPRLLFSDRRLGPLFLGAGWRKRLPKPAKNG